jgi:hypothetical protein
MALLQNKITVAEALKRIKRTELRTKHHRTMRKHNNPRGSTGLTHIFHQQDNNIIRIDDPTTTEEVLHTHFQCHFGQATATPFTVSPLREIFGYGGHNDSVQQLLDDQLEIPNVPVEIKRLLSNFKRSRPALSSTFQESDIMAGFLKWRESTTTSPSGKHLGIYSSITRAVQDNIQCSQDNNQSKSIANKLFSIQTHLLNLAIREEHSYNRWHTVHNFVIEKILGYPILNKLLVIHLFESDWNLILKYFTGRQVLYAAVNNKTTTQEQAGVRPGRRAIDEAVQTILNYKTCNLQHKFGGITYNDATPCYDRIPENLASIAAIKEGLHPKLASLHSKTFSNMKYHVKHKARIAAKPNQHSERHRFHGVGQGAGEAPA